MQVTISVISMDVHYYIFFFFMVLLPQQREGCEKELFRNCAQIVCAQVIFKFHKNGAEYSSLPFLMPLLSLPQTLDTLKILHTDLIHSLAPMSQLPTII